MFEILKEKKLVIKMNRDLAVALTTNKFKTVHI